MQGKTNMLFNKCLSCGENDVPGHAAFCIACGQPMENETVQNKTTDKPQSSLPSNTAVIGLAVLILGILIAVYKSATSVNRLDTNINSNQNSSELFRAEIANQLLKGRDSNTWTEEDRARRKTNGVRLGMSKEEVLGSSWGKPKKINTTTNLDGTHEQWVYDSKNYLYFYGNTLISIEN